MRSNANQPTRVLIADESTRARRGLRAVLNSQTGMEVVGEAAHGEEALSLLETLQPDVILLDVNAPIMDGIRTTQIIKARWPGIRVVAISLYTDHQAEALAAGADTFLIKGCLAEELVFAIAGERSKTTRK